jgi:glycosyltransferase involved in cell wall biosynthesis
MVNALTYSRNDTVFAVSEGVRGSIAPPRVLRGSAPRPEVLYHGIDERLVRTGPAARAAARLALGIGDGLIVGSVGSLTPKKDHATLIEAFQKVRVKIPVARLVIIGGGPLQPELEHLIHRLELTGSVHLLGVRSDVQDLLPGLDVFVLGSRHEGLGLALVEAMAAGVACVGSSVDGIPEVISHGVDGLLVPPGDSDNMAAAIVRLLGDHDLRAGLAEVGRGSALRFSVPAAMERMQTVYARLMAQRQALASPPS